MLPMRFSQLFGKTLREAPADISLTAHQLAVRAALARRNGGAFAYLPLGWQAQQRLRHIIRAELSALGGQEMSVEEDSILLYSREINSYRDLPKLIYQAASGPVTAFSFHANQTDLESFHRNVYHALLRAIESCAVKVSAAEAGTGMTAIVAPHAQGDETLLVCSSQDCGYASAADFAAFRIPAGISGEPKPLEKVATPHCPTIP